MRKVGQGGHIWGTEQTYRVASERLVGSLFFYPLPTRLRTETDPKVHFLVRLLLLSNGFSSCLRSLRTGPGCPLQVWVRGHLALLELMGWAQREAVPLFALSWFVSEGVCQTLCTGMLLSQEVGGRIDTRVSRGWAASSRSPCGSPQLCPLFPLKDR